MTKAIKKAVNNTVQYPITTIIGLVIAGATTAQTFMSQSGFDLKNDWPQLLIAVIIAIFGCLKKYKKGNSDS